MCLAVVVLVAISAWTYPIQAYDPYWLMAMGRDYLSGIQTSIDQYSFTYNGQAVAGNYHYFGSLLYLLTQLFGLEGAAQILRIAAITTTILVVSRIKYKQTRSLHVALAVIFILSGIHYRFFLRPELLDYLLIGVAFYCYFKALANFGKKEFLKICVLIFIWNNYHAAILGYVIFFGLYAQLFIESLKEKRVTKWLKIHVPSGLMLLLIGTLRPELSHPIIDGLGFSGEWGALIREHYSFATRFDFDKNGTVYVIWPIVAVIFLLATRTGHFGIALIVAIFAIAAWERIRMISFLVEVLGFAILIIQKPRFTPLLDEKRRKLPEWATTGALLFGGALLSFTVLQRTLIGPERESLLPREITAHLQTKKTGGNIVNTMHFGGWLIYSLYPKYKVFIDGRTNILYPVNHLQTNVNLEKGDTASLMEVMKEFPVDYILIENHKRAYVNILLNSEFRSEYISEVATLFSKAENPIPVTNLLLHYPMCWDPIFSKYLRSEKETISDRYADDSQFNNFVNALASPKLSERSIEELTELSDRQRRTLAFRLLHDQSPEAALILLQSMRHKSNLDLIAQSFAALESGSWLDAKVISLAVISGMWNELINLDSPPPTPEQLAVFVEVAHVALRMQRDNEIDAQLETWLPERGIQTQRESESISLIYREHCDSLARSATGDFLPVDFENIGFERYGVSAGGPQIQASQN